MEEVNCRSYLLERFAKWIGEKIRMYMTPILSGYLTGFLAHLFAFTNKLVNFDEVGSLFDKGTTASSGRWGLDILQFLFPNISMPWIYGFITITLLTISVCVIIHIFSIRSKLLQALLAGLVLTFPSLTATTSFMYTLSSYALAFLLMVTAVWLLATQPKKGFLPAALCCIFSVSIYQSYISIAASLLVLLLIQKLLRGDSVMDTIQKGFLYLGFLILSLGVYFLITKLVHRVFSIEFNDYVTGRVPFSLSYLPTGVWEAYRAFVHYFTESHLGLVPVSLSRWVHYVCIGASGILLVIWCVFQKQKQIGRFLLLGALLVIFPLAVNCIYLFVSADPYLGSIHTLVIYSFVTVYLLAIVIMEQCPPLGDFHAKLCARWTQIALDIVTIGMVAVIIINTYLANAVYLNMYLRYENAYGFFSTLLADLKMMPEFDENTQVAVIGRYPEPYYYYDEFPFTYRMMGTTGFEPHSDTKYFFMQYYLGVTIPTVSKEEANEIAATPEFIEMPTYPYYGSMKMIGDTLVVKLS